MDSSTIQKLLAESAKALRTVQAEKEKLASQLARYQEMEKAEEIVTLMDAKGIEVPGQTLKQKVASVLASGRDLQMTKEALRYTTADMSFARAADDADPSHSTAEARYQAFILS